MIRLERVVPCTIGAVAVVAPCNMPGTVTSTVIAPWLGIIVIRIGWAEIISWIAASIMATIISPVLAVVPPVRAIPVAAASPVAVAVPAATMGGWLDIRPGLRRGWHDRRWPCRQRRRCRRKGHPCQHAQRNKARTQMREDLKLHCFLREMHRPHATAF